MRISVCLIFSALVLSWVRADVVELRDGSRIEGRILNEKEDGLELEIGSNPAGTIRRVLIIHSSEIKSYSADAEGRISRPDGADVTRLSGKDYVERILREAEGKVAAKDFDGAIVQFQQAADIAGQEVTAATPEQNVEGFEQRAHSLRLLLAALEGKIEFLESRTEGVQESMDEQRKKVEGDWEKLQTEIAAAKQENETQRRTELGQLRPKDNFAQREADLRIQIGLLQQRQLEVGEAMRRYEEERIKTEAQIKLVTERSKKAESDARTARTELRRRK
jgi:predicted  nucleic acid-binding Zn-ribbon protein